MDAYANRVMNTQIIDDFLESPPLDEIRRLTVLNRERLRDEVLIKYTSEMDADRDGYFDLQKRLNREIVARLIDLGHDVQEDALTLSLLRISGAGYDGSLHHDKNCNPARKLTVVLYFNTPEAGGELVFPCYDRNRQRVDNPLTEKLVELGRKGQFDSDELQNRIDVQSSFSVIPAPNRAVIIDTADPATWHKATKILEGFKITYVACFE